MSVVESWFLLAAPATICAAILGLLDERTVRPLAIGLGRRSRGVRRDRFSLRRLSTRSV